VFKKQVVVFCNFQLVLLSIGNISNFQPKFVRKYVLQNTELEYTSWKYFQLTTSWKLQNTTKKESFNPQNNRSKQIVVRQQD
jgi:hypothetical protein